MFFKRALDIFLKPIYIIVQQSLIHQRLDRHSSVHQPDAGVRGVAVEGGVGQGMCVTVATDGAETTNIVCFWTIQFQNRCYIYNQSIESSYYQGLCILLLMH